MKKKRSYIFISTLIIILVFSTAVTCNLCGTPVEIILPEEAQTDLGPSNSVQEASGTSEPSGNEQQTGSAGQENSPPLILDVELFGYDTEFLKESGFFDEIEISGAEEVTEFPINITATDSDGDELTYSAYDDRGNNFEVTKIDNNNGEFTWPLPSGTGPYTLTIEVSDGGSEPVTYSIEMNFVLGVVEFILPEPEDDAVEGEDFRSFSAVEGLTGQIDDVGNVTFANENPGAPSIYVGDLENASKVYGFISFDVGELVGKDVNQAWLNISGQRVGDPASLSDIFSIYATAYGISLDPGDIGSPQTGLYSRAIGFTDWSFSNDNLKNAIQAVLDEGRQFFQIKLFIPVSNHNGLDDGFSILLSDISLEVSYD